MRISDWSSDVCSSDLKPERPELRFASAALGSRIVHDRLSESEAGEQAFHEPLALTILTQDCDHLPVHQPEIADVGRQWHRAHPVHYLVEHRGGIAFRPTVLRPEIGRDKSGLQSL